MISVAYRPTLYVSEHFRYTVYTRRGSKRFFGIGAQQNRRLRLSPSKHPMTYYFTNKFVITEHGSFFFPYRSEFSFPLMIDILREIWV